MSLACQAVLDHRAAAGTVTESQSEPASEPRLPVAGRGQPEPECRTTVTVTRDRVAESEPESRVNFRG